MLTEAVALRQEAVKEVKATLRGVFVFPSRLCERPLFLTVLLNVSVLSLPLPANANAPLMLRLLMQTQGMAWLCCDARRQVRMQALTYLQRALLVHDLQTLDAMEWESCFNKVMKSRGSRILSALCYWTGRGCPGKMILSNLTYDEMKNI